jgi:hypothetical protein
MKSGNLNFLEPSGSLQACNGTALPFTGYSTVVYQLEKYYGIGWNVIMVSNKLDLEM